MKIVIIVFAFRSVLFFQTVVFHTPYTNTLHTFHLLSLCLSSRLICCLSSKCRLICYYLFEAAANNQQLAQHYHGVLLTFWFHLFFFFFRGGVGDVVEQLLVSSLMFGSLYPKNCIIISKFGGVGVNDFALWTMYIWTLHAHTVHIKCKRQENGKCFPFVLSHFMLIIRPMCGWRESWGRPDR